MFWCSACERNEPFDEKSWRTLYLSPGGFYLKISNWAWRQEVIGASFETEGVKKFVCGDEGAVKLTSRWLSTGSLDAPRGAAADPPKEVPCS
jgi:hypothetical protein